MTQAVSAAEKEVDELIGLQRTLATAWIRYLADGERELLVKDCRSVAEGKKIWSDWRTVFLFGAPELRRIARLILARHLSKIGVYRSFADLPQTSEVAVSACLWHAATSKQDVLARALDNHCAHGLASSADGLFIATLFEQPFREWKQRSDGDSEELCEFIEFTRWIAQSLPRPRVGLGNFGTSPPPGRILREFGSRRAYRGIRRSWARRLGKHQAVEEDLDLPPCLAFQPANSKISLNSDGVFRWLRPLYSPPPSTKPNDELLNSFGAMIVEWSLSNVRHWKDRENRKFYDEKLASAKNTILNTFVKSENAILWHCPDGSNLIKWLCSELEDLTTMEY